MHISIIDMFFLHVKLNCNAIIWFGSYLWPWNIFAMFSPDWFLLQISIGMVQLEALFEPLLDLCSLENVSWWTTFFPPSFGKILINNPMLFTCSLFDWFHEWGFTLRNSIVEFIVFALHNTIFFCNSLDFFVFVLHVHEVVSSIKYLIIYQK